MFPLQCCFAALEFGVVEIVVVWIVPNTTAVVGVFAATAAEAGGRITEPVSFGWRTEQASYSAVIVVVVAAAAAAAVSAVAADADCVSAAAAFVATAAAFVAAVAIAGYFGGCSALGGSALIAVAAVLGSEPEFEAE